MKEYKNIEKFNTLDDGTVNVLLRNGKKAVIEIVKFNEKFQAAVYALFTPDFSGTAKKKRGLTKLAAQDAYRESVKAALGWIDDNPMEFQKLEEVKEFDK